MPFLTTLFELRPLVRSQAGVARVKFIGDDDLNPWIVGSWARLYDQFAMSGDPYFEKEALITSSGGAADVPSNLYRLRIVKDPTTGLPLDDLDVREVGPIPSTYGGAVGYRLRAGQIQLPRASDGHVYTAVYVPRPQEPRDQAGAYIDTDTMDCVSLQGRDWVVMQSAIKCYEKKNEDPAVLIGQAGVLLAELKLGATKRTISKNRRVADTQSAEFEDPYLSGFRRGRR